MKTHTEGGRLTLDPTLWVETSGFLIKADVDPVPPPRDRNESVNQKAVEAAIDRWRGSRGHPGEGVRRRTPVGRDGHVRDRGHPPVRGSLRPKSSRAEGADPGHHEQPEARTWKMIRSGPDDHIGDDLRRKR